MNSKLFDLEGRVALVTGSARGLGRGYAEGLAGAGAVVICMDRDLPEETVDLIKQAGGKAESCQVDIADPAAIRTIVDDVVAKHGSVDILVNNAGTEIAKDFLDYSEQEYDIIMGVNMRGLFFTAQAVARHMVSQRSGKIINQGSLGSQIGLAGSTVYCATKGGVLLFTRALAIEMAPFNVQVNAIGPGYFRTGMTEPFFQDPEHRKWIENRIPAGRVGTHLPL